MLSDQPTEDTTKPAAIRPSLSNQALAATSRPFLFWLSFLLLNLLLFLPAYYVNRADNSLLPPLAGDWREAARQLLAWRHNLDPFRLNAEFTALIGMWVFLPRLRATRGRSLFLALISGVYMLVLLYAIYENLSLSFYREDPVFYVQARLIVDGLPFLLRHLALSPASLALAGAAVALAIVVISGLLHLLTEEQSTASLGAFSRAALLALLFLILASFLFNGRALAGPKSVVSCLTCKLSRNISSSFVAAERVRGMEQLSFDQFYDYGAYGLVAQPDIYLIFVESYGSVLYRRQKLKDPYLALVEGLEQELQNEGWHAATILSESPTWGGGSWMAYTSTLFGLRVDSHPAYLSLLERFADGGYPHLGATLQQMGYQPARVTSLSVELDDEQWEQYKAFYGVERWLRYGDLAYDGKHYGWGPAPPDQYVLNAANEKLKASSEPLFLFMIMQNSHYPWQEVPEIVSDWRELADGSEANPQRKIMIPKVTADPANFLESIRYELTVLTDFILQEVDEEAIVILVGDHQPGYITNRAGGYDTPLHIISRDDALVNSLSAYGFEEGLSVGEAEAGMKHEGFYSLLMRALLDRYGRGDRLPPPYWPDGVQKYESPD